MNKRNTPSTELDYLAELVGEFIEYWGFKRVHGRVWAHLYLSGRPMDAAELMDRLEVSKALMSMTLSTLLEFNVIQPAEGKGRHGARLYQANPNPTEAIVNVLRSREKRLLAKISSAHRLAKELPASKANGKEIDSKRLASFGSLLAQGEGLLDQIIAFGGTGLFDTETP